MTQEKAFIITKSGNIIECNSIGGNGTFFGELRITGQKQKQIECCVEPSSFGKVMLFEYSPENVPVVKYKNYIENNVAVIIRENNENTVEFQHFLKNERIVAVSGVDTKAIKDNVSEFEKVLITTETSEFYHNMFIKSFDKLQVKAKNHGEYQMHLEESVAKYQCEKIGVIDFGIKDETIKYLNEMGLSLVFLSPTTSKSEIAELDISGIYISDGACSGEYTENIIKNISEIKTLDIPIFAEGLGYCLLMTASGLKVSDSKDKQINKEINVMNCKTKVVAKCQQKYTYKALTSNNKNTEELAVNSATLDAVCLLIDDKHIGTSLYIENGSDDLINEFILKIQSSRRV